MIYYIIARPFSSGSFLGRRVLFIISKYGNFSDIPLSIFDIYQKKVLIDAILGTSYARSEEISIEGVLKEVGSRWELMETDRYSNWTFVEKIVEKIEGKKRVTWAHQLVQ